MDAAQKEMLGIEEVDYAIPEVFQNRARAIKQVIEDMPEGVRQDLNARVESHKQNGLPPEIQRRYVDLYIGYLRVINLFSAYPNYHLAVPQYSIVSHAFYRFVLPAVPYYYNALPQYIVAVPQYIFAVPQYHNQIAVPQYLPAVPLYNNAVP